MIEPTNLFVKLRPTPGGEGSVADHELIAKQNGTVWWGRWSSATASRNSIIEALADQINRGHQVSLFIRNSTINAEFRAQIIDIQPPEFRPPTHLVPAYRNEPQVDMWLELTQFTRLPHGWITQNCIYATGKLEAQPVHYRGTQSLQYVAIRP